MIIYVLFKLKCVTNYRYSMFKSSDQIEGDILLVSTNTGHLKWSNLLWFYLVHRRATILHVLCVTDMNRYRSGILWCTPITKIKTVLFGSRLIDSTSINLWHSLTVLSLLLQTDPRHEGIWFDIHCILVYLLSPQNIVMPQRSHITQYTAAIYKIFSFYDFSSRILFPD